MQRVFRPKTSYIVVVMLLFMMLTVTVVAAELSGEEILQKITGSSTLSGSGSAVVRLRTINRRGQEKQQSLSIYRLETKTHEKQLIEFLTPADVKGTKFLSLRDLKSNAEEMWLYLPALKRERRIAGHMTKDNFMGTDFTYEEISGSYQDKYSAKRLKDEEYNGKKCYVLELTPKDKEESYKTVKMWVWQSEMIPIKIEFYNKDNKLWKEMHSEKIEKQANGIYLPLKITMSNKIDQTTTIIEILENSSNPPKDDYFTMQYLRR
ncbi:MAG TPA: outer membrane lipoprotein-sorting protein [Firmicutes bacterium]|nr:outer membrane lipoprotein-sorting protein [Bacillota bacterium]